MRSIPYGRQFITEEDIHSVTEVLSGEWLTQGPKIEEFEKILAEYCGAKYAVVLTNGTAALHLANLVLQKRKKPKVLTSPISFVATSNSIIYADGEPVFCDIDKHTFTLDVHAVQIALDRNPDCAGIIPVHLGGVVADMEAISEIAHHHNMWIVEDACHALGGHWTDTKGGAQTVGNCAYSDMTIFSFHPVKQITTGEGGAITTNSETLYKELLKLRSHGITRDPTSMLENHGGWYYEMQDLGFNYRLTDFQAALGIAQLRKNNDWSVRRSGLVERYNQAFKGIPQISPQCHSTLQRPSYHLYIVQVKSRKAIYEYLKDRGISTQVHYIPIHLQPYYRDKYGYKPGDFPNAEDYYKNALSLPLFPGLSNDDQDYVIRAVKDFYLNG